MKTTSSTQSFYYHYNLGDRPLKACVAWYIQVFSSLLYFNSTATL